MIFSIAGFSYRASMNDVKKGDLLSLELDPSNPYDKNAIKIMRKDGKHLGFVPKHLTHLVKDTDMMTRGVEVDSCVYNEVRVRQLELVTHDDPIL